MTSILVIGSLNIDLVVPVARIPRPGETVTGSDLQMFEGGKGANQACAVGRLGGACRMVGQVGTDAFGDRLVAGLRAAGVDVTGIGRSTRPTGSASIFVQDDGENVIVVAPGANASMSETLALERLHASATGDIVLGQLEIPVETTQAVFAEARTRGATTMLDPAPARALPVDLVSLVDLVTPNQSEARVLVGERGSVESLPEARAAAHALRRAGYRGVVLKLGALGCYVAAGEVDAHVPGFAVKAVDTTAAGDTFNGAFAVALAEGASLLAAARFANAAAALSVTRPGAQASVPSRAEVDALLAGG